MLQLRLPLHAIVLPLTSIHATVVTPIPIHILINARIFTTTHIHIPITTGTHTPHCILTSVPHSHAPIQPQNGIPPHLSLLAG